MARLWSSGLELNSLTANVELTATNGGAGTKTIDSSVVRSGTYSFKIVTTSVQTGFFGYVYQAASTNGDFYFRFYFRYTGSIGAQTQIITIENSGGTKRAGIRINTDGTLELWNEEDSAQVGSDSTALTADTWYRIELRFDTTTLASSNLDGRINGTSFASGTVNMAFGQNTVRFGAYDINSAATFYYEDISINDSSGSSQNSWPGEEEIIHLRPNAAGDNNALGVFPDSNNYQSMDEVTPDDATTQRSTLSDSVGEIDDYNIDATPAAMDTTDTINVVQVGVRYTGESTTNVDTFVLRIKASSGGTVEESAGITPNSTSYTTNANAAPKNYPFTLYDLPGASTTAWTKADLDATQIGWKKSADSTVGARVSTLWLLVGHKPAAGGGGGAVQATGYMTPNTGFWGI